MSQTSFHTIENLHTQKFVQYAGLITNLEDCPSEKSISNNGLEKLYRFVIDAVKADLLETSTKYINLITALY